MKSSLSRYLLLRVAVPAAVVNVVLNGLIGAAIYRGRDVPLLGTISVGGDTLVGAFLIAFFTFLGEHAAARLAARAGRLRGFGVRARWLAWPAAHPVLAAIASGVLCVALVAVPVLRAMQAAGVESLPRGTFLAFKVTFAGVLSVAVALVAALVGLAPEEELAHDARWCLDPSAPVAGPVYPCDYMDKATLAGTSRERGCSFTPTWDLGVRGALDPEHVRRALADLAARYPTLSTKVQSLDGAPPVATKYRYAHDPAFRVDAIFEVVDLRSDPSRLAAVQREHRSRHLDLFTDFPVTLTMAITSDDTCRLLFRQHHASADGRAFIGLLVDFAAFLNDARAGRRPAPEALVPVGRRGEVEALGLSPLARAAYTAGGFAFLARSAVRAALRPLVPLLQNRGDDDNDYKGENGTVHWVVPDSALARWSVARKRIGVSLNTLLTGALMLANQRLHRAQGLPLGRTSAQLLMETRPRSRPGEAPFVSFANHLTFLEAEADLGGELEPAALLRSIQAQVDSQRDRGIPIKRLLCERAFVLLVPLEQVTRMIFETTRPTFSLNFSNLIPLEFPPLGGPPPGGAVGGWSADEVRITTPVAPRFGVVLTVIRYRGELVFNFNYKASVVTREQTEALREAYEAVLGELTSP